MPHELDLNGPLTTEVMKRMSQEPEKPEFDLNLPKSSPISTVNPTLISVLGPIADAISTYKFMKDGSKIEENPAFSGLSHKPGLAALAIAGGGLALPLLMRAFRGKGIPEKIADSIMSNTGAMSSAIAASNFEEGGSSFEKVNGLLSNVNRINEKQSPNIPSSLSGAQRVAGHRLIYGDHRNQDK